MMTDNHQKFGLFKHAVGKIYPPNTTLFREGDEGRLMYAIKHGEVDIMVGGKTVDKLTDEEVFGEMALLEHLPRAATAVTRANTELVEIDEPHFYTIVKQHPYFALQLMRLLSERLRRADALYTVG